jgi:hypothetical protein
MRLLQSHPRKPNTSSDSSSKVAIDPFNTGIWAPWSTWARRERRPVHHHVGASLCVLRRAAWDRTTPDGGLQLKHAGRLSWLLWHSAYFTMTLSTRNK